MSQFIYILLWFLFKQKGVSWGGEEDCIELYPLGSEKAIAFKNKLS